MGSVFCLFWIDILIHQPFIWQLNSGTDLQHSSAPRECDAKIQAGFDAWFIVKATNGDTLRQFRPAILLNQLNENHFKRNTM